jgi:hypothetical protein
MMATKLPFSYTGRDYGIQISLVVEGATTSNKGFL